MPDQINNLNIQSSAALDDVFYRYTHLHLGGKEVCCPYWVNSLKKGIFGPYGGKGTPEQIAEATVFEAKRAGVDLAKISAGQILDFMTGKRIGVDCSGFAFWMADAFDKERGGNGIADDIAGSEGRYLQARANARMLTDSKVAFLVDLKYVRVGDLFRLNGGKHVAIVVCLIKDEGKLNRLVYAHSSATTARQGVHQAEILIADENKGLEFQEWQEKTKKGINYGEFFFDPKKDDGIKRLKIWK